MPRSPLQKGPATDHYHDHLGVDQTNDGSGSPVLATDGRTTIDPTTSLRFPPGTLADLGGGLAGVGFFTTLLGPFRINWDDVGIDSGFGIALGGVIPGGSWIWDAAAVIVDSWQPGGPGTNSITIETYVVDENINFGQQVMQWAAIFEAASIHPDSLLRTLPSVLVRRPVLTVAPAKLYFKAYGDLGGDGMSAGASDVHVLVSTPAS